MNKLPILPYIWDEYTLRCFLGDMLHCLEGLKVESVYEELSILDSEVLALQTEVSRIDDLLITMKEKVDKIRVQIVAIEEFSLTAVGENIRHVSIKDGYTLNKIEIMYTGVGSELVNVVEWVQGEENIEVTFNNNTESAIGVKTLLLWEG